MALTETQSFSGGVAISADLPKLEIARDVVFLPFSNTVFFDRDPSWGIYRLDGSLHEVSAYRRGDPPVLIGQSEHCGQDLSDIEEAPNHDYIYAGPLIPHFGHYLLTSLSRLWPLAIESLGSRKLLFHAQGAPIEWFHTAYVRDTLGALGLTPSDCVTFDRPVKLRSLIVPERSFFEAHSAYTIFADLAHRIGRSLIAGSETQGHGPPIYLSKTRLAAGVGKMVNEQALIDEIRSEAEIEIIYPEELSLSRQAAIFMSGRLVVGTTSSAFHTSIFSEKAPTLLGLSLRESVPSNFKLIDIINRNRARYVYPDVGFERREQADSFMETFTARDVRSLAHDIVKLFATENRLGTISGAGTIGSDYVEDHAGADYRTILSTLHERLKPRRYLEIASLSDRTLDLAECASLFIGTAEGSLDVALGLKPSCALYRFESDVFFQQYDPAAILGGPIDLAFLDGRHLCEALLRDFINVERRCSDHGVIVLHDCLPVELPMADRELRHPAIFARHSGWWTGDIWRTVLALRKYRPDLCIVAFNAAPTGLILVSSLDPHSEVLQERFSEIVDEMMGEVLRDIGLRNYMHMLGVVSTSTLPSFLANHVAASQRLDDRP